MKYFAILFLASSILRGQDEILFIRGGLGTVGFFEGGADEQGASIYNFSDDRRNHGWGELASVLESENFSLSEVTEDYPSPKSPVPLETLNLSDYSVIVFGSNNAEYGNIQINALTNYIQNGGSALFIADANFGSNWADSSSSDSQFLAPFGLSSNQDSGTYQVRRSSFDFLESAHPILIGVDSFDGEGVSPARLTSSGPTLSGVAISRLARVPAGRSVARNESPLFSGNRGSIQSADANDGPLITATYGTGRIAIHFDRNTFFNLNGAGTNINRFDNERYARNLFNWLAGKPDHVLGENAAPRAHLENLPERFSITAGEEVSFQAQARDMDGVISSVELFVNGVSIAIDSTEPYEWKFSGLEFGLNELTLRVSDNKGVVAHNHQKLIVENLGNIPSPLNRDHWVLSSNINGGSDLENAIDGNQSSRWPTRKFQEPGQALTLDLGARQLFDRVVMETAANPNDYPRGYVLSGSDNGVTFTQITSDPDTPTGSTTSIMLDRPRTFRYLKIEQTGRSSNRWWSIHELNVFKPAPGDSLPLESWLELHEIADLDVDPDGDGRDNFFEFALHSHPHLKNLEAPLEFSSLGEDVVFAYRRRVIESGVDYLIQSSTDLENWSVVDNFASEDHTLNGDGSKNVSFIIPRVSSGVGPHRYFRLWVGAQEK